MSSRNNKDIPIIGIQWEEICNTCNDDHNQDCECDDCKRPSTPKNQNIKKKTLEEHDKDRRKKRMK